VVHAAGGSSERFLWGADASVSLPALAHASSLSGRAEELRGRSVLIRTRDQVTAALALIELDGVARRLVLCPYDLPAEHVPYVVEAAEIDAVVASHGAPVESVGTNRPVVPCSPRLAPLTEDRRPAEPTEWILLTSGTTGAPKLLLHSLQTFAGAIAGFSAAATSQVWSTFYDMRRYGGLVLFLRALSSGGSMVLSSAEEPVAAFLGRVGMHGVTHLTGSPSLWRRALMSPAASLIAPRHIRLSGEVVDQPILDRLRAAYPEAEITHAFASTEAGLAFEVTDGLAGFPASFIGRKGGLVELRVEDDSLRIRSPRTAVRYLGPQAPTLKEADGFIDTGDMVQLRGDRYHFVGRRDGVINVGGLKVYPEEIEAVINQHPRVRMALVRRMKSSITGALVVAEVVLREAGDTSAGREEQAKEEILQLCQSVLARHKVPAAISVVPALSVASTGKLVRRRE
jgi:acyl-CoA synthetase (AMP-forming)/AMP-acid ligase II